MALHIECRFNKNALLQCYFLAFLPAGFIVKNTLLCTAFVMEFPLVVLVLNVYVAFIFRISILTELVSIPDIHDVIFHNRIQFQQKEMTKDNVMGRNDKGQN